MGLFLSTTRKIGIVLDSFAEAGRQVLRLFRKTRRAISDKIEPFCFAPAPRRTEARICDSESVLFVLSNDAITIGSERERWHSMAGELPPAWENKVTAFERLGSSAQLHLDPRPLQATLGALDSVKWAAVCQLRRPPTKRDATVIVLRDFPKAR